MIVVNILTMRSCVSQWAGADAGAEGVSEAAALSAAVRALSELVARRRLAPHALLGAATRLRLAHVPEGSGAASSGGGTSAWGVALGSGAALLALCAAAAALLVVRRRRAAAERARRRDEEKSNNLQNEENLRRYANPLRDSPPPGAPSLSHARPPDELPRAHTLYKAQNADARNNTPPRDKELTKRALPPPDPPPARRPPPERLTVLV